MAMPVLSKEKLYTLIPKANVCLSVSAAVLVIYLILHLRMSYDIMFARNIQFKSKPYELIESELFQLMGPAPRFEEQAFGGKELLNASAKEKGAQKKQFILLGTSIGSKSLAMIRDVQSNKEYYCKEGDKVGNFTVSRILKDKVILESEGGTMLEITQ